MTTFSSKNIENDNNNNNNNKINKKIYKHEIMQTTFTSVIHPAPARNVSSKVRLSAVTTNKVFLLKFQKI